MKDQAHLIKVKSDGPVQCTFDAARGSKHDSEDFNLQLDLETMTSQKLTYRDKTCTYFGNPLDFLLTLIPYPCSWFYADVKFDIRFDIKLWNSFHVNHIINFVTKYMIYGIV